MGDVLSLLLLGFAVSLDSFTVGLTYGMRKVKIPLKSFFIIFSCTFIILLLAMGIGSIIELFISYEAAERVGGIILVVIGIWVLYQFFTSDSTSKLSKKEIKVIEFEMKRLGLMIKILKKPTEADFDRSGSISSIEALFLGLALSLDSFGAGIGAALIDLPPILFSIVVTVSSVIFVIVGINIGLIFRKMNWVKKLSILPGIALILIGLFKM
ncbi:sporulation membrane protein YtaF [Ureibacillus sp. 179-F W5.1 NHS]|uniref:Sporulation membrane protein YtaF n=1 Tax=Lysinibacillus halotolerans TaxID=1368476 RepID=A0A3M8H754_9BACI|nr:sporulation membrane protein YtaF [Lysinibacillus halotolerans]RNC97920.1 sporulation membrane protein YtaF [Lysinibacillus halotolerans]